jgi:NADH-ubiquinone oxidoreductase chain 2
MLIISLLSFLVSNAVTLRRDLAILLNRIAIISLSYCILHTSISLFFIEKSLGLHGGLLYLTNITQVFHIFILLICILILQLTSFYVRKGKINNNINKIINIINIDHIKIIEYPLILMFVITGSILLISTNDLVSIFLAIELQSYGLYLISTIHRNSELSTIGGLVYFLLGSLSSCIILLGIGLLYSNTGTSNLDNLYIINNIININNELYNPNYINNSILILSIGLLFKISAAPFHFWSPDVYDAIPTIITTFVSIIAKISIFILLLQLVYYTNNFLPNFNWTFSLLISSLLSLVIGTVVGLTQFRIKRLFAYSTISHVGFLLLGLSIYSIESIQAFTFYLIQYSITNLNMFIILIMMGYSLNYYINEKKEFKNLIDKINSPIQLISQLKGYFFINPLLSISFILTIFSFVGIPPLVGFFGKQMILSAAIDKGFIFLSLVAITTSVISAAYYLNLVKEIFFFNSLYKEKNKSNTYILNIKDKKIIFNNKNFVMPDSIAITISIITLITIIYIFINKEFLSMNTIMVNLLFNT